MTWKSSNSASAGYLSDTRVQNERLSRENPTLMNNVAMSDKEG